MRLKKEKQVEEMKKVLAEQVKDKHNRQYAEREIDKQELERIKQIDQLYENDKNYRKQSDKEKVKKYQMELDNQIVDKKKRLT
jgi:hypothetical protein